LFYPLKTHEANFIFQADQCSVISVIAMNILALD